MTLLHRTPVRPAPQSGAGRPGPARVLRRATSASRLMAAALVAVGLLAPGGLAGHQTPLLVAGFVLGLPHGAVDHLLPVRHAWVRRGLRPMLVVLAAYVGVALLAYAGLRLAGPVVLPVLLVVSVLHFGAGDLEVTGAGRGRGGAVRLLLAAGRGAPVVAGPLLAWPAATGSALAVVGLGAAPGTAAATVAGWVLLGLALAAAGLALHDGRPGDALDVALLVALFVLVPPLAAFGVYFGAWHGLRHTARLLADDPANADDLDAGRLLAPLGRFVRAAALPSVVALGTAGALVALAGSDASLAAPVFDLLLALTVPHVAVVALLDRDDHRDDPATSTVSRWSRSEVPAQARAGTSSRSAARRRSR
ncbi:beta-carotene 15,15'-monooxygenase, Brp/Blh family [Microlunatus sagamiharensis]|uniref:Probable beta-carotene 15,15'-dioxygenase n=1 Tax=Microlunatus sagamiharensis TaxID=546874 RepID=A0A1H2LTG1_9ACTN|nr:Brp/Blh family beta-carotene 15,15'-dioxygenase [Microlunatus sagamiharensis]SDU83596.1 beta-carotene 15,15'-monooxygenase, Brp/Blh family [Microlunatus sagamiharensis]